MNTVFIIIAIPWSVRIVRNTLAYVQLWYDKEYRFDRMRIHLHTVQGKRILFPHFGGLKKTPKSIGLVLILLAIQGYALVLLPFNELARLFIIDLLTFPLSGVLVLAANIPLSLYHRILIDLAVHKLKKNPHILVVGITGSYGKTSTKEYLSAILSSRYRVIKTQASKNSLIGISEVILRDLKPEHEIFVVEMGAYKKGEIAEMVRMVRPQIGIITAINEQHQDLFGSMENTMKAKYELLSGLSGGKVAIVNGDNEYVQIMIDWAKKDSFDVWQITKSRKKHAHQFVYSNVNQLPRGLAFTLQRGDEIVNVHAPVIGPHQAINISLALAGAVACGIELKDAVQAAASITPIDRMMKPLPGIHGSLFIDDTFNNNPDAAIAAIDYLALTKGKKILVFQPMIELGAYARSGHERVGRRAAEVCDDILLTNMNYYRDFARGSESIRSKSHREVMNTQKAADFIRSLVKSGDTVLFKGKEAQYVLRELVP